LNDLSWDNPTEEVVIRPGALTGRKKWVEEEQYAHTDCDVPKILPVREKKGWGENPHPRE